MKSGYLANLGARVDPDHRLSRAVAYTSARQGPIELCMGKQSGVCDTPAMSKPKRRLRVVKWVGTTPAVAVCTCCDRQFKIPLTIAAKTLDAQENLKMQFDNHKCKAESDAA